ncbi:MAG: TonB-dependent receptor [Candidatus Marinimicrobia bacterium]|nr:TonB-dependent receptor [Candidatus Neomarinimicrobiota bacterium]
MSNKYIIILCIAILLTALANGQIYSTYQSDTIVVTGHRIPTSLSEISRNIKVISDLQIKKMGASSINELLASSITGDLQSRGPGGVQTDLHLRGSSFNQVLILIDGMKVNDPQTGHHNLNLPLTINDIEKIEVLKGAGSRLYGPNAMGGIINIITKRSNQPGTNIKLECGQNNYLNKTISLVAPLGKLVNRISYSNRSSEGYRHNTDYNISNLFYRTAFNLESGHYSLKGGISDKDFGANEFYTPNRYPDQRENTQTIFLGLHHYLKQEWGKISSKLAWRQHTDRFILDHTLKPNENGYYENNHKTRIYTAEIQATINSNLIQTNLGAEIGREKIKSNSLGNHHRHRLGFYLEGKKNINRLTITPGLSIFHYSDWDWRLFPGIDMNYKLSKQLSLTASAEKSFSPPTYTNLYYSSPVNQGNSGLKPEQAWSFETGLKYSSNNLRMGATFFLRKNKNQIDYAWHKSDSIYKARNVNHFNIYGPEFSLSIPRQILENTSFFNELKFSYTYLKGSRDVKYRSKYVFNYLQHCAVLNLGHSLPFGIESMWNMNYKKRVDSQSRLLIDWNIFLSTKNYRINLNVDNLFDVNYREFGYLPMPGRWIKAGIELRI